MISASFYWFKRDLIAYSILAAATLVDLFIYGRLKDLSVCYRCHTEFRGPEARNSPAFDLHTADVLEMEYEEKDRQTVMTKFTFQKSVTSTTSPSSTTL